MKEWSRSIIDSPLRIAIPIMTHPGIEMAGLTVFQAVTDGSAHAEAIARLDEKYPSSATSVIMDLTVEAEAFGAPIIFEENSIPTVKSRIVFDEASVERLAVPSTKVARVPEFLKANRITAERISGKPVFAGCIGPFSLAGRLYDMSEMMMEMFINPAAIHTLLAKCTQFITAYLKEIKNTGVNGVIMAEPAAGLVSNEDCKTFSSSYISQIVSEVQDDSFMVVLHNCGNTGHCTEAMVSSGAAAFHFGNQADMVEALKACPSDSLVMGNIDPVGIMKMADAETVRSATLNLLERTAEFPNFVLSTGCDVPPHIPFENIEAFYSALKTYNSKLK